jgi:hypothetical protein
MSRVEGLPIIVVFVALIGCFIVATPQVFLSLPIYFSFLTTVPPVLVLALGLTFVIAAGEIDLSFPSVIAFSGYLMAMLYRDHDMIWLAVLAAIAGGALIGLINGLIVAYIGVPSIITTLATQFFWGGITTVISGGTSYSLRTVDETSMWIVFVGKIGEFPARGMEPHDVALLADGRTMVIANGGIKTHPDSGADELNLPDMKPSLVYVDLATGDLVEEQILAADLHQLSIRHLALAAGDTVVFGCQYRGPEADAPPLLGFHRRGEKPVIVPAPTGAQTALKNYIGSVSADFSGGIVAASAPKGGLITYWDVGARRFLGSCELNDGCGIAPTRHKASFLLTSGQGWLVETEVANAPGEDRRSSPYEWDNHAIRVR